MRSFSKESLRCVHGHFGQLQYAEVHVAGGRTEGPVDFFGVSVGVLRTASMKIPPKLGTYTYICIYIYISCLLLSPAFLGSMIWTRTFPVFQGPTCSDDLCRLVGTRDRTGDAPTGECSLATSIY